MSGIDRLAPGDPLGRYLLTAEVVLADARAQELRDGAVLVEDGVVQSVGPLAAVRRAAPLATELAAPGSVLLPGFVDAHSHLRGVATADHGIGDAPLEVWILRLAAMAPLDPHDEALVGAVEAHLGGVTTVQVIHHTFGPATAYRESARAVVDALSSAGLSAEVILALTDRAEILPEDLEASLTDDQRALMLPDRGAGAGELPGLVGDLDDSLAQARSVTPAATGPWLRVGVAPVGPQWASEELLAQVAALAGPERRVHTHALETAAQRQWVEDDPLTRLRRHGLLTEHTSLAHGIHLRGDEVAELAVAGVAVATCPASNQRLADGVADVGGWRRAGLPVALGLDSSSATHPPDAFADLRALQRRTAVGGDHLDAREVLEVATTGGACAVGRQHQVGALVPGARADLLLVRTPGVVESADPVTTLIARAVRADLELVASGGRAVVVAGRHHQAEATRDALERSHARLRDTAAERAHILEELAAVEPVVEHARTRYGHE